MKKETFDFLEAVEWLLQGYRVWRVGKRFHAVKNPALTPRQAELLGFIKGQISETGSAPTYDEMLGFLGSTKSRGNVGRIITGLEERGAIRRIPNRARGIEVYL